MIARVRCKSERCRSTAGWLSRWYNYFVDLKRKPAGMAFNFKRPSGNINTNQKSYEGQDFVHRFVISKFSVRG